MTTPEPTPKQSLENLAPTRPATVNTVWGYFRTPCTYESAAALVSLHQTKQGAWRAMHRATWAAWVEAQAECRLRAEGVTLSKGRGWRMPEPYVGRHISPVEIQPD